MKLGWENGHKTVASLLPGEYCYTHAHGVVWDKDGRFWIASGMSAMAKLKQRNRYRDLVRVERLTDGSLQVVVDRYSLNSIQAGSMYSWRKQDVPKRERWESPWLPVDAGVKLTVSAAITERGHAMRRVLNGTFKRPREVAL